MPLKKLGILNAGWGVCGFTGCFYGLWDVLEKTRRSQLMGGTKAHRLLAEIKSYLTMLQAEGKTELLNDITEFCRAFGEDDNDFGSFTIENYIARINDSVSYTENQIKKDENFGIGMPPHAVVDYLHRMWEYEVSVKKEPALSGFKRGIIGVENVTKPLSPLYDGLEHYMYQHEQDIYSWGQKFSSVDEAAMEVDLAKGDWKICCLIPIE